MRDKRTQSMSQKALVNFDIRLFDPSLLRSEVALEVAISELDGFLSIPAADPQRLVDALLPIPHGFEFAISAINNTAFLILSSWIMNQFPTTPDAYASSLGSQLLSRFSLYLHFLSVPSAIDAPKSLGDCRRSVGLAARALQALCSQSFSGGSAADEPVVDAEFKIAKRQSQLKRKQMKRARSNTIDMKPFNDIGENVPHTREEADIVAMKILNSQKDILELYLEVLRYPHLKDVIKRAYIPEEAPRSQSVPSHKTIGLEPSLTQETESVRIPVAYPMVQPMKAALYFDSADGFGDWRILISRRADSDLRQARKKSVALFGIVIKKIKELSNGHFSDDNQKQLTGTEIDVPIFEAKMTRDSRLVYQVDCVSDFESDVERQVLKIFGIYTHAQLDKRFWNGVGNQLGRKGKEYKRRCIFRNQPQKRGNNINVIMPASFPPPLEPISLEPSSGISNLHKDDLAKLHELLVLEKYVTFSQAFLNSVLADQETAHVFDVSPEEKRIIEHASSCYVLGRSGTGKTTTMLFKMLGIERSWQACKAVLPKPRQLFVTQSRVLAEKVQEFFLKLYESLSTADKSPDELIKIAATRQAQQEQGLVDLDEEIERRGDLPKTFGELKDDHFPLFVTFDHLCRLLEADFIDLKSSTPKNEDQPRLQDVDEGAISLNEGVVLSNDYMQQRRAAFVSFGSFLESYWIHFPQSLTKGLDPTLVFSEFMGVIKGSEQSLNSPDGFLDKDTYFGLSHRTQATFANQRDAVYKLFLAYLKKKRERRDYDAADRTRAILNSLRNGVPGKQVDFIYIDEAQDNLLIDALVLRTICKNPDTGLFWAGDTAQTISVGSAFRFNDLKAFLYRVETYGSTHSGSRRQPQTFQLGINYRSHAGIVDCAHSVIDLITQFWPAAIDTLAKERGVVDGLKPVFFTGWDEDTVRYEQFLFGESGSHIEFGAQQCILVRDDTARENLRAQVGDIGLIMTLYESKGLEFNDVLLYNFFADSKVELAQWRVILNALSEEHKIANSAPRFDEARHSGVCRELKFLYVAITRARKNLWIADSSEKGEPMRVFWSFRDQIQNCTPGTDVPQLAMSSTPDEWAKTALTLFHNRRYMQAMHCYERASLHREKAVANAYYLREQARSSEVSPRKDGISQSKAFTKAAEAFLASAEDASKELERRTYFRIAAECYLHNGDDRRAAEAYLHAAEFTLSAQHFRNAEMFDEAIGIIKSHRSAMIESVTESIIDVSRLYYLRDRNLRQARELFPSDEKALEYMDDYGLDIARATLLEELGRFAEAAELHLAEGRTLEAIRAFLKDSQHPESVRRASQCLLDGLWRSLSFGLSCRSDSIGSDLPLQELLRLSTSLDATSLDDSTYDQMSMFRAIMSDNLATLLPLGERFHLWHHNDAAAFLCLDHVFSSPLKLQAASLADISTKLQTFLLYARLLQKYASDPQPCDNEEIQRLLGFETSTQELFLVPNGTLLYLHCNARPTPTIRATDQGYLVLRWELAMLIKHTLCERLRRRITDENEACRKAWALQPCLSFAAFDRCNRQDCPQMHQHALSYDADFYTTRVRVYLQQILIYHTLYAFEHPSEQGRQRRYWLRRFYDALYPPFYKMGALHNLKEAMIPELGQGLQIVRGWALDILSYLEPYGGGGLKSTFLTSLMRFASLSFTFDMKRAQYDIPRMRCVGTYKPVPLLRGKDMDQYVVHDMLQFMEDSHPTSLLKGILFSSHILEHRIPVDVGVLCDFLDHICGLWVVCGKFQQTSTLHDVTLPRSWLTRLAGSWNKIGSKDVKPLNYLNPMEDLLEQMYTGVRAEHLLFESRDLSTIGFQIRSIFIARICKNLFLLGYNCRYLQEPVLKILTSLRKPGRKLNELYDYYATAHSWESLARAARRYSTMGSSLDEMIQLHEASRTSPHLATFPNVRRIVYNTIDEIPTLLTSEALSLPKNALRGDAAPFVPARQTDAAAHQTSEMLADVAEVLTEEPAQPLDGIPEDVQGDDDIEHSDAEDIVIDQTNVAPVMPSEQEIKAGCVILNAYRKYVLRHSNNRSDGITALNAMRHRVAATFLTASQTMDWSSRYYRMLFLGPIAHLYVCVECIYDHVQASKARAKKRLTQVVHKELEDVNQELTHLAGLNKESNRLKKVLEPCSDLHVRRDLEELKARVAEVEQLMRKLPSDVAWRRDLELAIKGIVRSKQHPAKKPKPELNVEGDLVDFYDY
ncbi:hypothetical protein AcV5_004043 [Taiwanofungus camphoratus]|nr:hypothetical protein AcV5_004043 [Antrodia cinnamomea]